MKRRRWSDEELGAALLAPRPSSGGVGQGACASEDLVWEMVEGGLDKASTAKILAHAAGCPDCTLALRVARAVAPGSPAAVMDVAENRRGSFAAHVKRMFMMPIPAFAVMVPMLLSAVVIYGTLATRARRPLDVVSAPESPLEKSPSVTPPSEPGEAGLRALQVLRLTGELSLRGGPPPAPVGVRLDPSEGLVLKLYPDADELPADASAPLVLRVLEGTSVVATAQRRVGDLDTDESLSFLLDTSLLRTGTVYRAELSAASDDAAHPRQSRAVLSQSFRLDRP